MSSTAPVVGILLAGGKSSRMGGGDKCLRPLGGRPILAHIIERLKPQVSDMIINANGEIARFAGFGLHVVEDSITGYAGPLAGVQAGLAWIKRNRPDSAYGVTVATDTPFFPADLVPRFLAELGNRPALLVARSAEGVHPVIGLWPVALADDIEDALKHGLHKVGGFTEQHKAHRSAFPAGQDRRNGDRSLLQHQPAGRPGRGRGPDERARAMTPPLFGVVGWKNSGKTTLMVGLIGELTRRGYAVSVIKHAHAKFEIDHEGRDSYKMREAGACQVALSSPRRFARDARAGRRAGNVVRRHPSLMPANATSCWSRAISARRFPRSRFAAMAPPRAKSCRATSRRSWRLPRIVLESEHGSLPVFDLNDVKGIADFVIATVGLKPT